MLAAGILCGRLVHGNNSIKRFDITDVVHEAWCHERGYVCMILEFGGRPIVGYFDSIEEMLRVYDR